MYICSRVTPFKDLPLTVLLSSCSPTVGVWKGSKQQTLDHYIPDWISAGARAIGELQIISSASTVTVVRDIVTLASSGLRCYLAVCVSASSCRWMLPCKAK